MKVIGCGLAVLALIGASEAAAQDSSPWTGIYVGVEGGYHELDAGASWSNPQADTSNLDGVDGLVGGLLAGYGFEAGNDVVLGVETDLLFHDLSEQSGPIPASTDDGFAFASDMLWSLSARAGMAVTEDVQVFIKAGYSTMDYETDLRRDFVNEASDSGWLHGFHVGGGVEIMLTDTISAKAEYRYVDFSKSSVDSPSGFSANVNPDMHMGFFGINFHL